MTAHSLLVVPLPGLATVVPPLGRGATVPHVPLVDPFADLLRIDAGVLAEVRSYFADVVPFRVGFAEVSQFPGGSTYLVPDPAAPFRHLTQGLLRLFPELPRRRGVFDVTPHLDVAGGAGEDPEQLQDELEPWLPVETLAREAALWWREGEGVRTIATFGFGTSAA